MKDRRLLSLCVAVVAPLVAAGCEATKSSNPTSPSVAGPIAGVNITPPKPLEPVPAASIRFPDQPVTLLFENASTNGQRPITYAIEIATEAGFANTVLSREGIEPGANGRTSFRLPDALAADRTYHWRVQARDGANSSAYSDAAAFSVVQVGELQAPVPLSPIGGVTAGSTSPELIVANAARSGPIGAVTYTFEVSTNETFSAIVASGTASEQAAQTRFQVPVALNPDVRYYWRARASDSTTTGAWCAGQSFRTPVKSTPVPPTPGPRGPVGAQRTIDISEAASIVRTIYTELNYNIGSSSSREERNVYFERAVAALHYGHSWFNPKGPDPNWCIKNGGAGRPQSDDVIVRCDSRDAWDLVGGIGGDNYHWGIDYIGRLPGDQVVYAPSASALDGLPR
jgi:hypothetical protein